MRIIPAIDLIDGKCVRLTRGDYALQQIYNPDPLEVAKAFEGAGLQYLHLVDLDGARARHIVHHKILHDIATRTGLKIDFGGGIKSSRDVALAFESGAVQITAGSIAVTDSALVEEWLGVYGPGKIILGADSRSGFVATHGWQRSTQRPVVEFIGEYAAKGMSYVICTDISRDGMLQGCAADLYREILLECPVKLIASGGVSCLVDLLLLEKTGCEGAIIGKALYENKITLKELSLLC